MQRLYLEVADRCVPRGMGLPIPVDGKMPDLPAERYVVAVGMVSVADCDANQCPGRQISNDNSLHKLARPP